MKIDKKSKKKIVIIAILIVILLIIIVVALRPKNNEQKKLESEPIEKRDIATSISATGVIDTDTVQNVTSKLTGFKIKTVNVKEGDKISIGDVICTFDTKELEDSLATAQNSLATSKAQSNLGIQGAQRNLNDAITSKDTQVSATQKQVDEALKKYQDAQKDLDKAKSELATVQSQLTGIQATYSSEKAIFDSIEKKYNELQTELNAATDDLTAKKAALSNAQEAQKSELEKAVQDAQARLNTVTNEFYQYKPTYDQALVKYTPIENNYKTISASISAQQANVAQLETTVNTLKSTYDTLVNTLNSTVKSSDSTIASMRDALSNSELSASLSAQSQESQIRSLQNQVSEGILKSNVNGTVTSVSVKPGDLYTGTTIAVIEGAEVFVVEAEIDEYDIADIDVGMKVMIKTDATRDEELEGRIIYTAPSATTNAATTMGMATTSSTGSATYKVKIALDTQNERLRLGMNARLSIITDSKENVWSVPSDAVYEREDGTEYIEILKDEKAGTTEELTVTTGIEGTYYIEIISDKLKNGMKVVLPSGNSGDSIEALIELMGADAGL